MEHSTKFLTRQRNAFEIPKRSVMADARKPINPFQKCSMPYMEIWNYQKSKEFSEQLYMKKKASI